MKKYYFLLLAFLAFSTYTFSCYAASPWTEVENYGDKTISKLGYGLRNAALGWTKIFQRSQEAAKSKDRFLVEGFAEGVVESLGRTVGGLLHVATFPLTSLDIPLPEDGVKLWPYKDVKPEPSSLWPEEPLKRS